MKAEKPKREQPAPSTDDVLARMLATPPDPKKAKPVKKAKKPRK